MAASKQIFSTNVRSRMNFPVPTIAQIKEEIERAWDKHGVMLWGDMEDMLVLVLKSSIPAEEQLAFCREIIDAYTKRGHFAIGPDNKLCGAAYHSELYRTQCVAVLDITENSPAFQYWLQEHGITFTILGVCFNGWTAEFKGTGEALEEMIRQWWGAPCDIYLSEIKEVA